MRMQITVPTAGAKAPRGLGAASATVARGKGPLITSGHRAVLWNSNADVTNPVEQENWGFKPQFFSSSHRIPNKSVVARRMQQALSGPFADICHGLLDVGSIISPSTDNHPYPQWWILPPVRFGGCTGVAGGLCSVGFVGGATNCADYPNVMESMGHAKAACDAVTLTARSGWFGSARITVRVTPL